MHRQVSFHALAEQELNDAASYYNALRPGLGQGFLDEVERAVAHIVAYPEAAALVNRIVRKKLVRRFPSSVMYAIRPAGIRILAMAHQKRRPFYWRGRR